MSRGRRPWTAIGRLTSASQLISVRSGKPAYPGWPDCLPDSLTIVGRVVRAGRRFA